MNFAQLTKLNEDQAREYLEATRWPHGAVCPHCEGQNVCKLAGKSTRPGVYKCRNCRKQFSVTVGTVMERSHVGIREWVMAFHLIVCSKKGISAHQLHRQLGITYKSAWHLAHRIRHAMAEEPLKAVLGGNGGTVEVDEVYIGGKPRFKGPHNKRGRGTAKAPVVALVERDGRVRAKHIANLTGDTLKGAIRECVDKNSRIVTDELASYNGIGSEFDGGHHTVDHGAKEYVRGDIFTNTAESYFALLKRGIHGTYHHISTTHLDRYCNEFSFRWGARKVNDGERREAIIRAIQGKRLTYKQPMQK